MAKSDKEKLAMRKRIMEFEMENEILKKAATHLREGRVRRYEFIAEEKAWLSDEVAASVHESEPDGVLCVGGTKQTRSRSELVGGEGCGEGEVLFSQEAIRLEAGVGRVEGRRGQCGTVSGSVG